MASVANDMPLKEWRFVICMEENLELEEPKKDVVKQLFVTAFKHKMPSYVEANSANSSENLERSSLNTYKSVISFSRIEKASLVICVAFGRHRKTFLSVIPF